VRPAQSLDTIAAHGNSEDVLGTVLSGVRDVTIAVKVGLLRPGEKRLDLLRSPTVGFIERPSRGPDARRGSLIARVFSQGPLSTVIFSARGARQIEGIAESCAQ
jgi:hypothetical protein